MAQSRTNEERIAEIEKKLKQLQARKRAIESKAKGEERKARTKRLIEIGGAVESVLGRAIEKQDLHKLIGFLKQQEERGLFFSNAMNAPSEHVQTVQAE